MQTTVFYSLGRCGHFAPQGRKSVALLVAALLLLFAGNARAGGLESFHGTWVFSKKATCVRLAATGNPEAANCEKTPDLADGLLTLDIDADYNIMTLMPDGKSGAFSAYPESPVFRGDRADFFVSGDYTGQKLKIRMEHIATDKLEAELGFRTPLVFVRRPEQARLDTPATSATHAAALQSLRGTWQVDNAKVTIVPQKTRGADGFIHLVLPPPTPAAEGGYARAPEKIPFHLVSTAGGGLLLQIHAAPPIEMGNGHGGSLTYLIEACEVSVAFMGERTIQAQVPSRGTVTLVKKK